MSTTGRPRSRGSQPRSGTAASKIIVAVSFHIYKIYEDFVTSDYNGIFVRWVMGEGYSRHLKW